MFSRKNELRLHMHDFFDLFLDKSFWLGKYFLLVFFLDTIWLIRENSEFVFRENIWWLASLFIPSAIS